LNYTIEQVLDYDIDWINLMLKQINTIDFEKNMFSLALHGAEKSKIDRLRDDFYSNLDKKKTTAKQLSINDFRIMGLSVGKENKTIVKR
jgi:hypothetical protein